MSRLLGGGVDNVDGTLWPEDVTWRDNGCGDRSCV